MARQLSKDQGENCYRRRDSEEECFGLKNDRNFKSLGEFQPIIKQHRIDARLIGVWAGDASTSAQQSFPTAILMLIHCTGCSMQYCMYVLYTVF